MAERAVDRGLRPRGMQVVAVLVRRELLRFLRQPARVAATVGTPLLFWALFAAGFAGSIAPARDTGASDSYSTFLAPGIITLIALFASIFSAISLIDDRNEGWLAAVLISPAPRWSVAVGKLLGSALPAWIQTLSVLVLLLLAGWRPGVLSCAGAAAILLLIAIAMSGLGLALAWRAESVQSFHAVMNLVFLPMWLVSGAFFDPDRAAGWLRLVVRANPLTWFHDALRGVIAGEVATLPVVLAVLTTLVAIALCIATMRGTPRG